MPNATLYFVLACFMATLIGSMMLVAHRDSTLRRDAAKLIGDAARSAPGSALNQEVVFRKRRLIGFLFFLLFLLILCFALYGLRFDLGALNRAGRPFTEFSAGLEIIISFVPLAIAVREWRYTVRVTDKLLTISAFTTKAVPLQDVSEVTIGSVKAASFCDIRLNGDEHLTVGSELKGFLDFVKILSENVNRSKGRP